MSKFSPSMLVPAAQIEGVKQGNGRTLTQVALDNINKMKEQFAAGDAAEGKRNFKPVGDKVAFTIRVNNTALVLGTYDEGGVTADVKEMAVPKAHFVEALDFYAERIKVGEFEPQLDALEGKRSARTDKMRSTRAAKRADKAAVPGEAKKTA